MIYQPSEFILGKGPFGIGKATEVNDLLKFDRMTVVALLTAVIASPL
jgi:hypothetical protein